MAACCRSNTWRVAGLRPLSRAEKSQAGAQGSVDAEASFCVKRCSRGYSGGREPGVRPRPSLAGGPECDASLLDTTPRNKVTYYLREGKPSRGQ